MFGFALSAGNEGMKDQEYYAKMRDEYARKYRLAGDSRMQFARVDTLSERYGLTDAQIVRVRADVARRGKTVIQEFYQKHRERNQAFYAVWFDDRLYDLSIAAYKIAADYGVSPAYAKRVRNDVIGRRNKPRPERKLSYHTPKSRSISKLLAGWAR